MKTLILALLLLLCSSTAHPQVSNIIKEYDRFEDRTRYWTTPARITQELDLTVTFSFKGAGAGHEIEGFRLIFTSNASDWRYLRNSQLYLRIDGKSVNFGPAKAVSNDVKSRYSDVSVQEILLYPTDYRMLQRISNANVVEIRLGATETRLPHYLFTDIKELLGKVQTVPKK